LDILAFEDESYPIHTFMKKDVSFVTSLSLSEVKKYVSSVNLKGKQYFFLDGNFLTLTKTCARDTPREKDFYDILTLKNLNEINMNKLSYLFAKCPRITSNTSLVTKMFEWFFSEGEEKKKIKLFQTFPHLINLLDEFESPLGIKEKVLKYSSKEDKGGYQLSTIMNNINLLIREVDPLQREKALDKLLNYALKNDYLDFDRKVNFDLLPRFRYDKKKDKNKILNLI